MLRFTSTITREEMLVYIFYNLVRLGVRICEICGKTAKNIGNEGEGEGEGDSAMLRMEMNEMRLVIEAIDNSNESNRRCKISFCNFLLGCLLLAFFLPWFFRGIDVL